MKTDTKKQVMTYPKIFGDILHVAILETPHLRRGQESAWFLEKPETIRTSTRYQTRFQEKVCARAEALVKILTDISEKKVSARHSLDQLEEFGFDRDQRDFILRMRPLYFQRLLEPIEPTKATGVWLSVFEPYKMRPRIEIAIASVSRRIEAWVGALCEQWDVDSPQLQSEVGSHHRWVTGRANKTRRVDLMAWSKGNDGTQRHFSILDLKTSSETSGVKATDHLLDFVWRTYARSHGGSTSLRRPPGERYYEVIHLNRISCDTAHRYDAAP